MMMFEVEVFVGGGMVIVCMDGLKVLMLVCIDFDVFDLSDLEMVQDFVFFVVNEVLCKVDEEMQGKFGVLVFGFGKIFGFGC